MDVEGHSDGRGDALTDANPSHTTAETGDTGSDVSGQLLVKDVVVHKDAVTGETLATAVRNKTVLLTANQTSAGLWATSRFFHHFVAPFKTVCVFRMKRCVFFAHAPSELASGVSCPCADALLCAVCSHVLCCAFSSRCLPTAPRLPVPILQMLVTRSLCWVSRKRSAPACRLMTPRRRGCVAFAL